MNNFWYRLMRFMYGRYGMDKLNYAILAVGIAFSFVNIFVRSPVFSILSWIALLLMLLRAFSRNIIKRRKENEWFLKIWNFIKPKVSLAIRRVKEAKTHRYRKCPHCKAMLRLPRRKGKHTVDCPRCHREFKICILW
jgi:hypothetical protein